VGKEIGPIAKPKDIRFGDNLPKTRSGKIMRRLLRAIAKGDEITQDTSTLENPAILEQLKQALCFLHSRLLSLLPLGSAKKCVQYSRVIVDRQCRTHIVYDRELTEQADVLKGSANACARNAVGLPPGDTRPVKPDISLSRSIHSGKQIKDSCLPSSIRANQPAERTFLNRKVDIVYSSQTPETLYNLGEF
jgi:hypothetical protein